MTTHTFREGDSNPKEELVPHQAGLGHSGNASYIDGVVTPSPTAPGPEDGDDGGFD